MSAAGSAAPLPLEGLLPHRDPMVLLTRALGLEGGDFVAEVDISADSPFFEGSGVPVWIGLEYMAQAVAAFAGSEGAAEGKGARPGLLLGARAFTCVRDRFVEGETLRIVARRVLQQDNGISAMECFIQDAGRVELARAQLTVIQLQDMAALDALGRP